MGAGEGGWEGAAPPGAAPGGGGGAGAGGGAGRRARERRRGGNFVTTWSFLRPGWGCKHGSRARFQGTP